MLLVLVIWEIKNNNHEEIILTVLLCCAWSTEGGQVVGYANGSAVAASPMIHRCWGGCRGALRGEGELESAWEVGDLSWGTVCTFPGRMRLEVVPCSAKTWWPLSGDGKSLSRIRKNNAQSPTLPPHPHTHTRTPSSGLRAKLKFLTANCWRENPRKGKEESRVVKGAFRASRAVRI